MSMIYIILTCIYRGTAHKGHIFRLLVPMVPLNFIYKFDCIYCFSDKHVALKRKRKDWLAGNQNNVSGWGDMSTCGLLFR